MVRGWLQPALVHAELGGYRLVAKPVCATQDHAAAIRHGTRDPVPADLTLKPGPLLIAQNKGCQRPTETTRHRNNLHSHTLMTTLQ